MKKWLVRISYHNRDYDLVAVVKTKDIEKYMNDFVKKKKAKCVSNILDEYVNIVKEYVAIEKWILGVN